MATLDPETCGEIERLHTSLRDWALGDVRRAFSGGAKVGAFILAAHVIDTLAGLTKEKGVGADAWSQFVSRYLPRYNGHARLLEDGFRNATSHNYSARGIRFVDGPEYAARHWTMEGGDRVLHFETFIDDLGSAYDLFEQNLLTDAALRERVLSRARQNPPLGVVRHPAPASLAQNLAMLQAGATSFAPAHAASGANWPAAIRVDVPPDPPAQPRAAVPKKRRKPKKRR